MNRLSATLRQRLAALAATNRRLRRGIARHVGIQTRLKERSRRYAMLLGESRGLQQDLRRLTHQMLRTQEDQRRHLSRELQDVIGQTLLGIHVKLQALRHGTRLARQGITGGIASTQRMVEDSARTVRKSTSRLGRT